MAGVPETSTFLSPATVIFVGMLIYLGSLVVRFRNLHQDEEMLEELEKKD